MSVRNSHVRQSSKYIFKTIDGISFVFESDTYVDKAKAYNLARKAVAGKVSLDPSKRSVIVAEDGSFRQETL